jgi:hypothetical protein
MCFQKRGPRPRPFAIGCRVDSIRFQDIGDGRVADRVADFGKLALNPIAAPARIFLSKLQNQIDDDLTDAWPSLSFILSIRVVPLGGD